jgi:Glycosyl transferase family 11
LKTRKNKITVELLGGLGNQLFVVFAGLQLSTNKGIALELDASQLAYGITQHASSLDSFVGPWNIEKSHAEPKRMRYISRKILNKAVWVIPGLEIILRKNFKIYYSKEVGYNEKIILVKSGIRLRGYFQSWKYFRDIDRDVLRQMLKLKNPSNWYMVESEVAKELNPVMLHIRRGDYYKVANEFGILSGDYFRKCIEALPIELSSREVWVFSDDPNEAEIIMSRISTKKYRIVRPPVGTDPAESMILMSKGSANIISNSTFSWWSAMLNGNQGPVLAPTPWFLGLDEPKDLIPPEWIRIESEWL